MLKLNWIVVEPAATSWRRGGLVLALGLILGLAPWLSAAPSPLTWPAGVARPDPAALDRAKASVAAWVKRTPHPGGAVVMANAGGRLWSGAWGVADLASRQPMTADTMVGVGSITKSFTALAVMQLVEQGKLGLDDPVVKYLPWFRLADQVTSDRITIRHCLNNASGIPSLDNWVQSGRSLDEAEIERDVRALNAVKSRSAPGEAYAYVNENWEILGLIVKKVSGQDFGPYLQRQVLDPMGMTSSTTDLTRLASSGAIAGSFFEPEGFSLAQPAWVAGALPAGSCLVSSANEMGAYLATLLNGGQSPQTGRRLLGRDGVAAMWQGAIRFPVFPADVKGGDQPGWYGMGWMRAEVDGRTLIFHGGNTMRTTTMTALDPATGYGVSLLLNSPGDLDRYRYEQSLALLNTLLHQLAGQASSDWGSPTRADPNLAEAARDPGGPWLDSLVGTWVAANGPRLELSREAGGTGLVARLNSPVLRSAYRVWFLDKGRVVFGNLSGTVAGRFELAADGGVRQLIGPLGMVFKRLPRDDGRFQAVAWQGLRSVLPKDWRVEAAAGGISARPSAEGGGRFRAGLVAGALPQANEAARQRSAVAAAGWSGQTEAFRGQAVIGAWSGSRYWESCALLPEAGFSPGTGNPPTAIQLAWCETPLGLVWLSLEAPAGRLTALNRELVRNFINNLALP